LLAGFSRFDRCAEKTEAWPSLKELRETSGGNRGIRVSAKLSARNQIEGKIVELEVDGVMAHVTVGVGKNLIESVITRRSADEMKLKVGDKVLAVIKSTEVMLQKG
jgi:molybdopterin-binding protein